MIRGLLTDEEWSVFEPFVVSARPLGGRPARDHRRVLDAIFWIARTGAPWRDLPAELGSWNSVFRRFRRWSASGLWDVMLEALADGGEDADLLQMIDSTSIRAHHCAAGGRGDSSAGSWPFARWLHEQAPHPRQRARPAHRPRADRPGHGVLRRPDRHEYELYLAVEDIDHTRARTKSPQTNGIRERFHKTLLDEFYRVAFRKKVYRSIEELQADLDEGMKHYNEARTHQGRWRFGKTPMQTFLDSRPLAREKRQVGEAA